MCDARDTGRLRAEGDINLTPARAAWAEAHIGPSACDLVKRDAAVFLHQSMSTPCLGAVEHAEGASLRLADGETLLDFHGNGVHLAGYAHPRVLEAVRHQLGELSFCPRRFTNRAAVEAAERLAELAPDPLSKVLFMPGATVATSTALKIARFATGRFKTISAWGSFHGATLDAISVGGEGAFRTGIGPLLPGTEHVMPTDTYRCRFGECGESCDLVCAAYLEYVLEAEGDVGCVLLETVRSTDVQVPPPGYLRRVREACDRHGALLVLDETYTGLGRTGRMFAFEHFDVVPDMVILGKGLGGGVFPQAALIVRTDLDVAGSVSLGHYTHEKSPIGGAVISAMLDIIAEEGLLSRSRIFGECLMSDINELAGRIPAIGDVRGLGALIGIDLVKDRVTRERDVVLAERVMYRCLSEGLSFKVSSGSTLTLVPPLTIAEEELARAVDVLGSALTTMRE